MRVSRLVFLCSLKDSMYQKDLFREGFLRTDTVWDDRCDHPRTLPPRHNALFVGSACYDSRRAAWCEGQTVGVSGCSG